MGRSNKERIEVHLDRDKDADLLEFIDENGTTRAGFIRFVLRHYMNTIKSGQGVEPNSNLKEIKEAKNVDTKPEKNKKKRIPNLGNSLSSNDIME